MEVIKAALKGCGCGGCLVLIFGIALIMGLGWLLPFPVVMLIAVLLILGPIGLSVLGVYTNGNPHKIKSGLVIAHRFVPARRTQREHKGELTRATDCSLVWYTIGYQPEQWAPAQWKLKLQDTQGRTGWITLTSQKKSYSYFDQYEPYNFFEKYPIGAQYPEATLP